MELFMSNHAILTAIGADRPGLVDEVSRFIFDRGGNIEDSRMVNLRGQFAMMVLVGGDEPTLKRIEAEASQLKQNGLRAELVPAGPAAVQRGQAIPYRLTATALDQPGLVHRIASLLRGAGVNIESMDTHLTSAPITGAPMFEMELIIAIPASTPIGKLRQDVGRMCDEMNIDWRMEGV